MSTRKQSEDRQILAMEEFGVESFRMVIEKQSGKDFARPENYEEIKRRWQNREVNCRKAAELIGGSHSTFLRWIKKDRLTAEDQLLSE